MNEPVKLGEVLDDQDTEIGVYREADGSVALWAPDIGWHERFEPAARDELRELLDRAAMPGQAGRTAEAHAAQAGDGDG